MIRLQWRQGAVAAVAALIAVRCLAAAYLPLSFDEAYYWLWSKHLAAGYYDHPPLIAFSIRAGTDLFGHTPLGVRALPLLFSILASWAVWRAGSALEDGAGARAALFFNLMLMTNVEMLTATPDAPLMLFSALFVLALTQIEAGPRAWLAAGLAGGLALLSKYTALFLGAGAFVWLFADPRGRRWLPTPWPYLGAALALTLFAPDLMWNAQHDWLSFRFQFGKAANAHFVPGHLIEFLLGQAALASPFILLLAGAGLVQRRGLLLWLCVPAAAFFALHALQARVEGNWPSFLYPVLALAAARAEPSRPLLRFSARAAMPLAAAILAAVYAQAFFAPVPLADPTARLLGYGYDRMAARMESLRRQEGAGAYLTTSYALTGWTAFYAHGDTPVIETGEPQRWLGMPPAPTGLLAAPMLYIAEPRRDMAKDLARDFASVRYLTTLSRAREGRRVELYNVYAVSGWHGRETLRVAD